MIKEITLQELYSWKADGKTFQLIDVREAEEHAAFNIGGQIWPLSTVLRRRSELKLSQPIVFYCKRGIRSQIAIQRLQQKLGTQDFYNLKDGIYSLIANKPPRG